MQDWQEATIKSLVAVAWADGRLDSGESEVVEALIDAFGISEADASGLREFAATEQKLDDINVSDLSAHDRRMLLQHAVVITFIDGAQSDKEKDVLMALIKKLNIPGPEALRLLAASESRAKKLLAKLN